VSDHLIGLLLGAEQDWPRAFETVLGMVGPVKTDGTVHTVSSERLTIEPFRLDDPVRTPTVPMLRRAYRQALLRIAAGASRPSAGTVRDRRRCFARRRHPPRTA